MDTTDSKPVTYCNDSARPPQAIAELCATPNWVVWRWTKNGSGKWTKPPFQSRFPSRLASLNCLTSSIGYKCWIIQLSNEHWERIRDHFPEEHIPGGRPGRKPVPTRRVLEAVL